MSTNPELFAPESQEFREVISDVFYLNALREGINRRRVAYAANKVDELDHIRCENMATTFMANVEGNDRLTLIETVEKLPNDNTQSTTILVSWNGPTPESDPQIEARRIRKKGKPSVNTYSYYNSKDKKNSMTLHQVAKTLDQVHKLQDPRTPKIVFERYN